MVVDAVAFFRNIQLQDVAENVHTLKSVVNEIRDKATRQRLAVLPYDLKYREPSTECIQIVSAFARKTGDYQSLSAVDIRVIALAYQLTREYVGTDQLKKQPDQKVTYTATKKPLESVKDIAGFYYPTKKDGNKDSKLDENSQSGDVQLELSGLDGKTTRDGEEGPNEESVVEETEEGDEKRTSKAVDEVMEDESQRSLGDERRECKEEGREEMKEERLEGRTDSHEAMEEEKSHSDSEEGGAKTEVMEDEEEEEGEENGDDEEEEEDDVGWITPQNISQVRQQMGRGEEVSLEGVRVGCMTTDFAMQNVLIQIGIPVISVNGMLIKHAKSFVLRCHDCFKITHDMGKVFCPKCGNKSMDKVTMTIDEDGTRRYHMSRRRPMNARGLRYALPKPQGGKHASNPILCADQRVPHNRDARKAQSRTNVFDPDYDAMSSPFATHDVTSRSALIGARQLRGQGSGSRRNPNENRRQNKKGKKK